jgi:hypothetical protein
MHHIPDQGLEVAEHEGETTMDTDTDDLSTDDSDNSYGAADTAGDGGADSSLWSPPSPDSYDDYSGEGDPGYLDSALDACGQDTDDSGTGDDGQSDDGADSWGDTGDQDGGSDGSGGDTGYTDDQYSDSPMNGDGVDPRPDVADRFRRAQHDAETIQKVLQPFGDAIAGTVNLASGLDGHALGGVYSLLGHEETAQRLHGEASRAIDDAGAAGRNVLRDLGMAGSERESMWNP